MSRELETASLPEKAYALSVAGFTNREIAKLLKEDIQHVHRGIKAERERLMQFVTDDERNARLFMETERLDTLQSAYWQSAMIGNTKDAEFVLKIIDRRIKLLGLDRPTEDGLTARAILIAGGTKDEFMEILQAAQKQRAAGADIVDAEVIEEEE